MRAAIAVLICSSAALAEGRQVSKADFDTYVKLLNERALGEARAMYAGGDQQKREEAKAGFPKALAAAGWSEDQFREVGTELETLRATLGEIETTTDKENAASLRQSLADDHDSATVELVRARKAELEYSPISQRAEQQARDEKKQASAGRAPSQAELQGKWKFDLDATIAHLGTTMGLDEASLKPVKEQLGRDVGDTTYTFSGANVEQKTVKAGSPPQINKGTFRVAGNDLFINNGGRREAKLQVGVKSSRELVFSMMGVGSIYRKQ